MAKGAGNVTEETMAMKQKRKEETVEGLHGYNAEDFSEEEIKEYREANAEVTTVKLGKGTQNMDAKVMEAETLDWMGAACLSEGIGLSGVKIDDYVYQGSGFTCLCARHPCCGSICSGATDMPLAGRWPFGNPPC